MEYKELEEKILEASIQFAEAHNIEYGEVHQSMLVNAMREVHHQLTKKEIKKILTVDELNTLHDIVYDITGNEPTKDVLIYIYTNLPENIKADGVRWGLDDSVVRDTIYTHIKKEYKNQ